MFFRVLLIVVAIYLVGRYLRAIFSPSQKERKVKGEPSAPFGKVDRDRIKDASFKDISDNDS